MGRFGTPTSDPYRRRYYEENKENIRAYARDYQRRRRYHLDADAHAALLKSQNGKCAACERTDPGPKGWIVDHDHKTGKVRGIVCHKCNVVIGSIERNAYTIKKLFLYILMHDESLKRKPRNPRAHGRDT